MRPFAYMLGGALLCALGAVTVYYCLPPRKVEIVFPEPEPFKPKPPPPPECVDIDGPDLSAKAKAAALARVDLDMIDGDSIISSTVKRIRSTKHIKSGTIEQSYLVEVRWAKKGEPRYMTVDEIHVDTNESLVTHVSNGKRHTGLR